MKSPSERLLELDMQSAAYRAGVASGLWGVLDAPVLDWPRRLFWLAAPPRPNSAEKFIVMLDCQGYRKPSPTGNFWDVAAGDFLRDPARRPKGKDGSVVAKVFRTDWKNCVAFYHPFDRTASVDHHDWPSSCANRIWTDQHAVADFLDEIHRLLNSGDYIGGTG